MRAYTLLHKGNLLDAKATAEKALEMTTIDGAKVLGMDKTVGFSRAG